MNEKEVRPSKQIRRTVYLVLEGGAHPWDWLLEVFIVILILGNVVMFIVSTIPGMDTAATNGTIFDSVELASVIVFTIEYVLRIYCCVERKRYGNLGPIKGRLRFMVTFLEIIDLLAIGPYWITLSLRKQSAIVAAVRICRLARLFKVEKYTHGITIMLSVVKNNREVLLTTLFLCSLVFMVTSTALYYAEKDNPSGGFNSIPATLYICTLMLTGQGVPDTSVLTAGGQWVVAITCVFSIAVFAVPAGILGWGFESVGERFIDRRKEAKKKRRKKKKEKSKLKKLQGINTNSMSETTDEYSLNLSSASDSKSSKSSKSSPSNKEVAVSQICPLCKQRVPMLNNIEIEESDSETMSLN